MLNKPLLPDTAVYDEMQKRNHCLCQFVARFHIGVTLASPIEGYGYKPTTIKAYCVAYLPHFKTEGIRMNNCSAQKLFISL